MREFLRRGGERIDKNLFRISISIGKQGKRQIHQQDTERYMENNRESVQFITIIGAGTIKMPLFHSTLLAVWVT